jgi:hypothetical protein
MTLSITTFSINGLNVTLSITTFSITTFSITTLSINGLNVTPRIKNKWHSWTSLSITTLCHHAESPLCWVSLCRMSWRRHQESLIFASWDTLRAYPANIILPWRQTPYLCTVFLVMPRVVTTSVFILNVVAPFFAWNVSSSKYLILQKKNFKFTPPPQIWTLLDNWFGFPVSVTM